MEEIPVTTTDGRNSQIKHSNESTEERPVFEMSLPVNAHTASSTCSKDSTMKNDVITTVTSTEVNTSIAKYSEKCTESENQEETHVIEDDALPLQNMTRYEKRKVVEDYQIKCLKQEHIKLKNENIKLLSEIDLIKEKKVITVLKKKLIKLQLKKMRLDMKVENEKHFSDSKLYLFLEKTS
ncbi:Hypothetical predicted protein [Mytilus galloprovincialis]|uniref:Uncharacterized protein n=1 Tax=Mytilus galloprovincialis TaxID=29158 RepID=A0A8B6D058_MYTGA|nr:Hypothetical predicted protein [Mytilus galloprovincialis]